MRGRTFGSGSISSRTTGYYGGDVGPGWYIDEVEVLTGPLPHGRRRTGAFEDASSAMDAWTASNGIWEIGRADQRARANAGGNRAHEGTALATILSGNYTDDRSSRIIEPGFLGAGCGPESAAAVLALVEHFERTISARCR